MQISPSNLLEKSGVFTVSALNQRAKSVLFEGLGRIRVTGEISNLSRAPSGHLYFSLKDEKAQVRCAFFKMDSMRLRTPLKDGLAVIIEADVGLYEPRGDFQLLVRDCQLSGIGALQQAFEVLKGRLESEGLFHLDFKKPLPRFPKSIALVTSPQGAAVHDMLRILTERAPHLPVTLFPSLVQGSEAAPSLAKQIQRANEYDFDILIVGRGGGSLEDLWPFNEEIVARAIFDSRIPVISAVGHEVDFTIADFVADVRAATPTAAAHLAVPDRATLLNDLEKTKIALTRNMLYRLETASQRFDYLQKRLQHPAEKIKQTKQRIEHLSHRLVLSMQHQIKHSDQKLKLLIRALHDLSPLATLSRGFSVLKKEDGKIVQDANQVKEGETLEAILKKGQLKIKVLE